MQNVITTYPTTKQVTTSICLLLNGDGPEPATSFWVTGSCLHAWNLLWAFREIWILPFYPLASFESASTLSMGKRQSKNKTKVYKEQKKKWRPVTFTRETPEGIVGPVLTREFFEGKQHNATMFFEQTHNTFQCIVMLFNVLWMTVSSYWEVTFFLNRDRFYSISNMSIAQKGLVKIVWL